MNTNPSRWTDEQLMAWADGALAAEEVAALEAAIEADVELANRAAAMQQTRALVQEAFDARSAAEPVPAALRAAVEDLVARDRVRRADQAGAASAAAAAAVSRPGWRESLKQWFGGFGMPTALAASLACGAIGFLIGQAGAPPDRPADLASAERAIAARDAGTPAAAPPATVSPSASPPRSSSSAPAPAPAPVPSHDRERSAPMARESTRDRPEAPAAAPSGRSASELAATAMADELSARRTARPLAAASAAPGSPGRLAVVGEVAPVELARLLDQLPGGGTGELGRAPLAMIATYRDREARVCRDFSVVIGDQSRLESVACRDNDATWQVTYAALVRDDGGGFVPASSNSALDAYLGSIGAVQPLDPEAEREALGRPGVRRE